MAFRTSASRKNDTVRVSPIAAGTPSLIVERYREAVAEAAADPATLAAFEAQFIAPNYEPGPVFEARMRSVQERYAELWRRAPWINA